MMRLNPPGSVEKRALQSLYMSQQENNRKQFKGEDKMIRALAISEDDLTCLVTPRTTFSGIVDVEWNESRETNMTGTLGTALGSASEHLQLPFRPDF